MIRIRTGASWRNDPRLNALRRASGPVRSEAARGLVDALALEIDGIDIAAGRAEGPLLPSFESLLRAVARVVGGAPHATVAFPDGDIELVIRRSGPMALLTVVALTRPTHLLARDVEVELDALAAAALEASAAFVRELAQLLPEAGAREARRLRAAARDLRRTETAQPRASRPALRRRAPHQAHRSAPVRCALELLDEEGLLEAYEGGRPDLGSLLAPGRLALLGADGIAICTIEGIPFLALRDLGAAADALLAAARRGEARAEVPLPRPGRGASCALSLDLAAGRLVAPASAIPCTAPDLVRAFAEAAAELGRVARARNPRQAENAYLAELEAAAASRIAQADELAAGDLAAPGSSSGARAPGSSRIPQQPLGPGRLRRLSFRRTWTLDVGTPAGAGIFAAGRTVIAAGAAAVAAVEGETGSVLWRTAGCAFAAALPGMLLAARGGSLLALAARSGRTLWSRPLPGAIPAAAAALERGPHLVVEPGAVTALDAGSGRTLWRFEPPGAARVGASAFGGIAAVATDAGFLYGIDAAGRTVWRVRAPGPIVRPPSAGAGLCLVLAAADPVTALLAVDPVSGARRWEARLDLVPSGPAIPWGRRIAVAGALGGDPMVSAVGRTGGVEWTLAPTLSGSALVAPAGSLLVVRDGAGALVALHRDGRVRWSRAAVHAGGPPGGAPPVVVRGAVLAPAGDGIAALDAATGEIVGAIAGAAPSRLLVNASLQLAAIDADGLAAGWRLSTHLSVV